MAIKTLRFSLMAAATAALSAGAALAQVTDSNVRAVNLARNWAVNNNGGLSVYRPAACMFNTSDGGGAPGWQQEGLAPTTETQVSVSPDGRTITNVGYNGTPR
jgi:hypothetical protein